MIELIIIILFLQKEIYLKHRFKVKLKKEDRELALLYKTLDSLMEKYNRDITLDEFLLYTDTEHPDLTALTGQLRNVEVGHDMLQGMLQQLVERQQAYDLALLAISASEGRSSWADVQAFYSTTTDAIDESTNPEEEFVTDDIEVLYNETKHKSGLRFRLKALNESLGSLRKGDFGFIFARPETGKTTWLASELTFMAEQLKEEDGPILWFNNEEGGYKVKVRIIQACLGCTNNDMFKYRQKAIEKFMLKTKGKIKLRDSATITRREIENLCRELKPSLIVFDQIDKIKGFENDREDLRLGAIYIWARELAKKYCPIIGVCQADVSGEGKKWLTMDNVANAKTSKQAEADWILGIGAVHDEGLKFVRYLHLSKNKLSGDEDSVPELRHGKMECLIKPDIARYEGFD